MERAELAIRGNIAEGRVLHTPIRNSAFSIARISKDGIVLLIGAKQSRTVIAWSILEELLTWLQGRGSVEIGGGYTLVGQPGTLDGFLKARIKRDVAGWVASLLEAADLVDIDRKRPAQLRARETNVGVRATRPASDT